MGSPGIFGVWAPSNQLCAEFSLNLPLKLLKVVAHEIEKTNFRIDSCNFINSLRCMGVPQGCVLPNSQCLGHMCTDNPNFGKHTSVCTYIYGEREGECIIVHAAI